MVEPLFLAVPRGCLRFVIPDHSHYFNTKHTVKIEVPCHKNECPSNILIHTKPFLVTNNLSTVQLFNKTFLRPLHDMSITLEMILTGYPKVL